MGGRLQQDGAGEGCRAGGLEWREGLDGGAGGAGGLEGWKAGGLEGLEGWRLELEGWRRAGGLEGWRAGGLEGWRARGLEGWRAGGSKCPRSGGPGRLGTRNSAILAIHIPLFLAYVSVSTEPPEYNHDYGQGSFSTTKLCDTSHFPLCLGKSNWYPSTACPTKESLKVHGSLYIRLNDPSSLKAGFHGLPMQQISEPKSCQAQTLHP